MKQFLYAVLALVCAAASAHADGRYAPTSLYNLEATLTDQSGVARGLDTHQGKPVLITMFYGSCPMACPLLIDTLRAAERALPAEQRKGLRVIMVSIDPQRDTPAALQKLAQERRIDVSRWTLARTDEKTVRKLAALLNVQYRRLPSGEYNHSSVITLLTPTGDIATQSTVIGKADEALVSALRQQLAVSP